ncbi:GMC family oxidoreductase [Sandarakinorhabdus sp.]|uniref:GMC family oxidoreductase n=1 Tax=Sandarakinorhabdus sp. TaxID=1916663 RepID=UPI003F7295CF
MLHDTPDHASLTALDVDLTVVGGGPVGLIAALAARARGARVLVLESGLQARSAAIQSHLDDTVLTPDTHHDGPITSARRLGGAGHLWGGRCVPYDPIDFVPRPWLPGCGAGWPLAAAELEPWLAPALEYLGAGAAVFESQLPGDLAGRIARPNADGTPSGFVADRLERWTNDPRIDRRHRDQIAGDPDLHVALGCTVTGAQIVDGRVTALKLWTEADARVADLPAREVILAGGGVATTRLLLAIQAENPALLGGPDGPLGRHYMGHLNGQIADIVIDDAAFHGLFDYFRDAHGSYVRRRIAPTDRLQSEAALSNVAFWPVVPEIAQADHRSGPLSAVFLGLSMPWLGPRLIAEAIRRKHIGPPPYRRAAHLRNLVGDPVGTLGFVPRFLWQRFGARARVPGFFLQNPARRYGLEFHAEHLPDPESRITLDPTRRDRTGLPHARIDFRFAPADTAPILRAHAALDAWLRERGLGRLIYRYGPDVPERGILVEAKHGNHQIGTARMGRTAAEGVVDPQCQCFGLDNLHIASTAVLPTSSQANPTLSAVQLALRLVDTLARRDATWKG